MAFTKRCYLVQFIPPAYHKLLICESSAMILAHVALPTQLSHSRRVTAI